MKNISKPIISVSLLLAGLPALAMPPKIEPTQVTQPDGSKITIKVVGGRSLNFVTTEDGTIVNRDNDGYFRLAEITPGGQVVSTGIVATPENLHLGTKLTEKVARNVRESQRDSRYKAPQSGFGMYKTNYPTTGSPRVPVILVEYQDVKFAKGYSPYEYFKDMVSGDNFHGMGAPGSVKKYFAEQSHGKFTPQFDIYGPVTLPREMGYYGSNSAVNDSFSHYMVSHALKILDPDVDFRQYDADGDGDIDFVYIIYAGYGENRGAGSNTVWPHAGYLKGDADFCQVDGVWANYYACSNELIFGSDNPEGIGAFVHEYSHIIGLPDLYPTDDMIIASGNWDYTPGQYTILDYGPYNNDGHTPPNYTAYERNALKWDEPIIIDTPGFMELSDISTGQFGLVSTLFPQEFYLFENRQQTGWDEHIPNHGLIVWHIEYIANSFQNNSVNNVRNRQLVELVRANNSTYFGHNASGERDLTVQEGFPFPGSENVTEYTSKTTPAFLPRTKIDLGLPITKIREDNCIVKFNVATDAEPDDVVTGIADSLDANDGVYTVYSFSGILIGKGDGAFLHSLPAGFYIVNGKKLYLNR